MELRKLNKSYSQLSKEEKEYIISVYYEIKDLKYPELQEKLGVSKRVLLTLMKEYGINARLKNRYTINENYFANIETEKQAYILGFICADGYVGSEKFNNVVITSIDYDIIKKISTELSFTGEIRLTLKGGFENSKNAHSLNFSNYKIVNDLKNLGIYPNKSLSFNNLLNIPKELQRHFLRGYFDGDGSITLGIAKTKTKNKVYEYETAIMTIIATPKLIEDIIKEFDIKKYSLKNSKTEGLQYLRIQSNNQMQEIYKLMYDDATIFLNRKKEKWDKFMSAFSQK